MSEEVTITEKRPVAHKESRKRSKAEIERDKLEIARQYLEQKTQNDIKEWIAKNRPYTLSLAMISITLKGLFAEWREQAVNKIDELKARDLAKLLDVERTATEAWERSLQNSEKTTHEHDEVPIDPGKNYGSKKKPKKPVLRVSVIKENRDGDPRFLEIILKCIERRADILGYRPNKKIEDGGEQTPVNVSIEVNTALQIAYGSGNGGNTEVQSGSRVVDTLRIAGGGPWRPEGSIP